MSVLSGSGSVASSTSTVGASNPTLNNVPITLANTEYSFVLPAGTKSFRLQLRAAATLKLSWIATQSGTTYLTIGAGSPYSEDNLLLQVPLTLYFQATQAAQILEIIYWS